MSLLNLLYTIQSSCPYQKGHVKESESPLHQKNLIDWRDASAVEQLLDIFRQNLHSAAIEATLIPEPFSAEEQSGLQQLVKALCAKLEEVAEFAAIKPDKFRFLLMHSLPEESLGEILIQEVPFDAAAGRRIAWAEDAQVYEIVNQFDLTGYHVWLERWSGKLVFLFAFEQANAK